MTANMITRIASEAGKDAYFCLRGNAMEMANMLDLQGSKPDDTSYVVSASVLLPRLIPGVFADGKLPNLIGNNIAISVWNAILTIAFSEDSTVGGPWALSNP